MKNKSTVLVITLMASIMLISCGKQADTNIDPIKDEPIETESIETESIETEPIEEEPIGKYAVFTSASNTEVEDFARRVQADVATKDWADLSEIISYPITIGELTFESKENFASADIDSLLNDKFYEAIAAQDCTNLFCNYMGAMFGQGQIWISSLLNEESDEFELKVLSFNILE